MKASITNSIFVITTILLIAFPKSGIYLSNTPIYSLYILILALVPALFLVSFSSKRKTQRHEIIYIFLLIPFWSIWISTATFIGFESPAYLGGHLFIFFIIPTFFYLLKNIHSKENDKLINKTIVLCVRLVSIFGIVSFIHTIARGDYINIPYITTAGGGGELDVWQRNNQRGDLFKLVSTYNNGNIYGLCLAALCPLYFLLEKKSIFKATLLVSLLLTLSRTVWILSVLSITLIYFEKINLKKALILFFTLSSVSGIVLFLSSFLGGNQFILDSSLGNRDKFFWMIEDFRLLPQEKISAITEIPYLSIYYNFGALGLVCFALFFLSPLLMGSASPINKKLSPRTKAANAGIFVYIFSSLSDSALLFVPSFAYLCFLVFIKNTSIKNND